MNINILQKGGKKNHELLDESIRFFAKQLMSTRLMNTLNIRVEIRATKLDKDVLGACSAKSDGSLSTKDFKIEIQRDEHVRDQVRILAHEMVHVWQKASNTLQYRQWKSDNKIHARWNGNDVGLYNDIPYLERPWEKEAYYLEQPLYDSFKAHKKELTDDQPELDKILKLSIRAVKNKREKDNELVY